MKKKVSKMVSLFLAMILLVTAFAACGDSSSKADPSTSTSGGAVSDQTADPGKTEELKEVTLRFYFGGDKLEATDEVWKAVSEKYKKELNAKFEINFVPFGDFASKLMVMASSGDNWDLNFDGDWVAYSQMVNRGAYLPLNELLPKYAPDLYAKYQKSGILDAATVNGQILALPWTMEMNHRPFFMWRKDLVQQANINISTDSVKTIEEVDAILHQAKTAFPSLRIFNMGTQGGFPYSIGKFTSLKYELADLSFYGFVFDMNDSGVKVIPFEQTQAFKEAAEYAKKWYDDGILPKDAVIDKTDINAYWSDGKAFATSSAHEWANQVYIYNNKDVQNDSSEMYPDKKFYNRTPLANLVAINKNAANPERALMFCNMMEVDNEFYDMVMYGILNKTYLLNGEEAVMPPELKDVSNHLGWASQWAFWKPQFIRPTHANPAGFWEREAEFASKPTNVNSPLSGLFFDPESIKNELSKREQIQDEFGKPILFGVSKDVDKSVNDYIEKQKAAGLDKITAELQKQVDAFLASKK